MNQDMSTTGLEPIHRRRRRGRNRLETTGAGVRVTVHGRGITLRGLRRPPEGIFRWLAILGPGMITGVAGNDAGGIATYSQIGAQYGYSLLWALLISTISLAVMQECSGRLGAATGRGLLDLIRERFGIAWSMLAVGVVLIANGGLILSEFVGVGAAMELLGVSRFLAVPLAAVLVLGLILFGSYPWFERVCLSISLVFLAYPIAAFLARPHWGEVVRGALVPTVNTDLTYVQVLVALIGATLTPYQLIFQQSSVVEKGVARRHYGPERIDTYSGAVFSNVMSAFMIIATAATLHVVGKTDINSAADAAQALRPVAGPLAEGLFAVGLLGASVLTAAVLPLATSYAISEVFGFPKGVDLDFRRGRVFFGLFIVLVVVGAAISLVPNLPVIDLLVWVQIINGCLLPVILLFMLLLINDKQLVGDLINTRRDNVIGWTTFVLVTVAIVAMLVLQAVVG